MKLGHAQRLRCPSARSTRSRRGPAAHGFDAVELAAWPKLGDRPFVASHIAARRIRRGRGRARRRRRSTSTGSSSPRSPTTTTTCIRTRPSARQIHEPPARRASTPPRRSAACPSGPSSAATTRKSVAENLREAERVFPALVDYAGERGVKLMIENCVMEGWHPDGYPGNLAYSPELWEWMFELGLWLNFDPSHLLWIGIDPVAALRPYVDQVVHAHAKDAETFPEKRNRYGFFGRTSTREQRPLGHGLVALSDPGPGRGRLPPLRRRAVRGRLRRRALDRARGPGLGRHARRRSTPGSRSPTATCDRWSCEVTVSVTDERVESQSDGDGPPLIEMSGIGKEFLGVAGARGRRPRLHGGRGARDRRRERRREVDPDEDPRRRRTGRATGEIRIDGEPVEFHHPLEAQQRGRRDHLPGVQPPARPHGRREHLPRPRARAAAS